MPQEIELKLALGSGGAQELLTLPIIGAQTAQRFHLGNTYFDTPAGDLEKARMALRIRRTPGRILQTLKTAGHGSGGLSSRGEWEWDIGDDALDLDGLAALPPMQAMGRDVLASLEPRFATDFERHAWLLEEDDGTRIEVALDQGETRAGQRRTAIDELELELKAGSAEALWRLATRLAEEIPLRPANASKAARGAALLAGRWVLPASPVTPAARFDAAILALDAWADSGDTHFRDQARMHLEALAGDTGLDAIVRDHARTLASVLEAPDWLTVDFGRHSLALQAALHPA
ncbi:MAG: CYTH domain-containing protein [Halomonas sp.]|nr:CYTH domain-containing protein [Halomonas sp.]